jgi:hypothetical protein
MGNGQWAMGNGQWAMGNGHRATGIKDAQFLMRVLYLIAFFPCPMPHAQCPMTADASSRQSRPTHCLPHALCPMLYAPFPFINKIVINSTIVLNRNYYINPLGVFNEVLLIDACVFG